MALQLLLQQAELVSRGCPLNDGRLEHFREAVQLRDFPDFVQFVRDTIGQKLFSALQEIESLERDSLEGSEGELVFQCGVILEMGLRAKLVPEDSPLLTELWVFRSIRDQEVIARLRFRLRFVDSAGDFQETLEYSMMQAVLAVGLDYPGTWQGILLLCRRAGPRDWSMVLSCLGDSLGNESIQMPGQAATLLLSYVCDVLSVPSCGRLNKEAIVRRLVELGGSLMVSRNDRPSLFRTMPADSFQAEGGPWWRETADIELGTRETCPTALSRLLDCKWSPEFIKFLGQHACCNLGASVSCREIFPAKLLKLSCLAARHVTESEMVTLNRRSQFLVLKHRLL